MSAVPARLEAGSRVLIAGAPEGHDAHLLGGLVAEGRVEAILHICIDDARMARSRRRWRSSIQASRC